MSPMRSALHRWAARQLAHPSGAVGRYVLAPLWNRRNAGLHEAAWQALGLGPGHRVLEIGFGGGALLRRMAAVGGITRVAGLDRSAAMVERAARNLSGRIDRGVVALACGAAEALPYRDGAFTHVVSVNSLFYWSDVPRGLAEARRVLAERGTLVLCLTRASSLRTRGFADHLHLLDEPAILALLRTPGWGAATVGRLADRHRDFVCLTVPAIGVAPAIPCTGH